MSTNAKPATRCPLCRKPSAPAHKPFCSQGCKDRDLLQWLGEGYRIPVVPSEEDGDPEQMRDSGLDRGN